MLRHVDAPTYCAVSIRKGPIIQKWETSVNEFGLSVDKTDVFVIRLTENALVMRETEKNVALSLTNVYNTVHADRNGH